MAASAWPALVERVADRADLAVHHPRRRDHVGARTRPARSRSPRSARGWRRCRRRRASVRRPQWPWSVYSSRQSSAISTSVVADLVTQVAQRDLHDAVGGVGARAGGVLGGRDTEQDHRGHAEVGERPHLLAQALLGVLHDARHRCRPARARRCLPSRTAARRGRRPRAGPRPPAAATRACGAAGASAARGTSRRPSATAHCFGAASSAPHARPPAPKAERRAVTTPSMVCGSASASTRRPRSTAVSEVTGPIETTSGCGSGTRADCGAEVVDRRRRRERDRVEPPVDDALHERAGRASRGCVRYTGSTSTVVAALAEPLGEHVARHLGPRRAARARRAPTAAGTRRAATRPRSARGRGRRGARGSRARARCPGPIAAMRTPASARASSPAGARPPSKNARRRWPT